MMGGTSLGQWLIRSLRKLALRLALGGSNSLGVGVGEVEGNRGIVNGTHAGPNSSYCVPCEPDCKTCFTYLGLVEQPAEMVLHWAHMLL